MATSWDAVVIGAGPNGLAAAITLARAGRTTLLLEAQPAPGGGASTQELTLPGFRHDVCSAVHPLAALSPFFRSLPLARHGLAWIEPPLALAHPFEDGTAATLERSLGATAAKLGRDGDAWRRRLQPAIAAWPRLAPAIAGAGGIPTALWTALRLGPQAAAAAASQARRWWRTRNARGLWAGLAAHSMLPLERRPSAAFAWALAAAAHLTGWPIARGGSQAIADALASHFRELGGELRTGMRVESWEQMPAAKVVICDLSPRQLARLAPISERNRSQLRALRPGPGVCKLDWALQAPIPWAAADCARAGTVHLGGTLEEIEASERAPWKGQCAARPFVLLAQPTRFDPTRAPAGRHIAWAYCHAPYAAAADAGEAIEAQIERFAPGFRRLILARSAWTTADFERHNANLEGGDIGGGAQTLKQLALRAALGHTTSNPAIFHCFASTPPGAGVHGLGGYYAARAALRRLEAMDGRRRRNPGG